MKDQKAKMIKAIRVINQLTTMRFKHLKTLNILLNLIQKIGEFLISQPFVPQALLIIRISETKNKILKSNYVPMSRSLRNQKSHCNKIIDKFYAKIHKIY